MPAHRVNKSTSKQVNTGLELLAESGEAGIWHDADRGRYYVELGSGVLKLDRRQFRQLQRAFGLLVQPQTSRIAHFRSP